LPLAPWLVAVALKGKGEARRFKEYVLMFVAFYIYHRGKLQLQSELDSTFDPSDVVTVSMVGLAIVCKEVGFAGVSMTMASLSTLLAAAVAGVGMVYYSVWSCKFFHSPAEVRAGAAFGLLLVLLKKLLGGSVAQEEEEEEEEESEAGYVALKARAATSSSFSWICLRRFFHFFAVGFAVVCCGLFYLYLFADALSDCNFLSYFCWPTLLPLPNQRNVLTVASAT
ncbi:unnamed protein product, partial [Polarella glacialis]